MEEEIGVEKKLEGLKKSEKWKCGRGGSGKNDRKGGVSVGG